MRGLGVWNTQTSQHKCAQRWAVHSHTLTTTRGVLNNKKQAASVNQLPWIITSLLVAVYENKLNFLWNLAAVMAHLIYFLMNISPFNSGDGKTFPHQMKSCFYCCSFFSTSRRTLPLWSCCCFGLNSLFGKTKKN